MGPSRPPLTFALCVLPVNPLLVPFFRLHHSPSYFIQCLSNAREELHSGDLLFPSRAPSNRAFDCFSRSGGSVPRSAAGIHVHTHNERPSVEFNVLSRYWLKIVDLWKYVDTNVVWPSRLNRRSADLTSTHLIALRSFATPTPFPAAMPPPRAGGSADAVRPHHVVSVRSSFFLFFFCIWSRHRSARVEESVEWVFRSLSLPRPHIAIKDAVDTREDAQGAERIRKWRPPSPGAVGGVATGLLSDAGRPSGCSDARGPGCMGAAGRRLRNN
ncbi:hypothetical protein TbgDal_IX4920 [Trypanosoma brucei gambiense DAL972]|uniref:Uncharacterized protein n=1 Tax=Trypanosoma brucei gambiense (strain MHOM/CI/86/DAL972) TaxID=679716 RepID=C9ZYB7_TRYB9|nr:hypothetical protein TbgDal_IX4920 [Trypanosoma brucei gambiense DAL972]CBH14416.1 hypothetical protein TbgDal_IX4920 [Trypanosoma brucei gambiense DAL972]|eukprot:XP_011776682.1 hypothetical protein TbgDal_IX4920 [Trypanosoma brucei gambiense DAL972]